MAAKKKGLGKGLDALLGNVTGSVTEAEPVAKSNTDGAVSHIQTLQDIHAATRDSGVEGATAPSAENRIAQVPVELCQRGKYQPRRAMDSETLEELASSIKTQGIVQPIVIREIDAAANNGARYEIIAGERRWRAAQLAGLDTVPAIINNVSDETAVAMALIENLQREDLNPMDQAYALARLQDEFELTHQQVADMLGKSRTTITNFLRLLGLQDKVKQLLENGDLEMGHARALLSLGGGAQIEAAKEIVNRNLTVRQAEALAKKYLSPVKPQQHQTQAADANIRQLQTDLSEKLGVPVAVRHSNKGSGQLVLKYNSLDELDGILGHIK